MDRLGTETITEGVCLVALNVQCMITITRFSKRHDRHCGHENHFREILHALKYMEACGRKVEKMTSSIRTDESKLSLDQILSIRPLVGAETPRWSPEGSRIVFVSSRQEDTAELWSVPADGGFPTRLTIGAGDGGAAPRIPLWSPDGSCVSCISRKSGNDEVWLWPVNGDPGFQLTSLGGRIHSMNWSPNGRSVAVSCNRYGSYDIYLVEVPSGKSVRLTDGPLYACKSGLHPRRSAHPLRPAG